MTIEAPGFKTWSQHGIAFSQGDSKTLPSVKLEIGQVSETVEIKAGADVVIPDNSEVSTTLNTRNDRRCSHRRPRRWRTVEGHAWNGSDQRPDPGLRI